MRTVKKFTIGSALVAGVSALALLAGGGAALADNKKWKVENQHGHVGGTVQFVDDGDDFYLEDTDPDGWSIGAYLVDGNGDQASYEAEAIASGNGATAGFHYDIENGKKYALVMCHYDGVTTPAQGCANSRYIDIVPVKE